MKRVSAGWTPSGESPGKFGRTPTLSPPFYDERSFKLESSSLFPISPGGEPDAYSLDGVSELALPRNKRGGRATESYVLSTGEEIGLPITRQQRIEAAPTAEEVEGASQLRNLKHEIRAEPQTQEEKTRKRAVASRSTRKSSRTITLEDISHYFHLPINDVAKELGVCATVIKKICRKAGIPRWPHRKIKSIQRAINDLEQSQKKKSSATNASRIECEIRELKIQLEAIMKNPQLIGTSKKRNLSRGMAANRVAVPEIKNTEETPPQSEPRNTRTTPLPLRNPLFISPLSLATRRHSYPFSAPKQDEKVDI